MGRFSADSLKAAAYIAVALVAGMSAREYSRAYVATRLGDPTPRLWGRLSWSPKTWFDPFGSGLLPGLILVLWAAAAGFRPPPFAYGKPAPVDQSYLKRQPRDAVLVGLAGPGANLALALAAGLLARIAGLPFELRVFLVAFEYTSVALAIYHLLPIPGLDGARLVALALPPGPRMTYRNLDQYLPLFALVALFLLAGPILGIVNSLSNAVCRLASGFACV